VTLRAALDGKPLCREGTQRSGFLLGDDIEGDYSTPAKVRDLDSNLLTLVTLPSRPYPPACPRRAFDAVQTLARLGLGTAAASPAAQAFMT
jgi:hypothetical protein